MNTTNHTSPSGEELKPCPFCGGTDLFVERLDYTACFVQCDSSVGEHEACCMRGPVGMQDDDDEETPGNAAAIRAWNRRAALTAEKVAAEPVAIVRDNPDDIGTIIEATRPLEVGTQLYLAAPQQPAQSAEQDERAQFRAQVCCEVGLSTERSDEEILNALVAQRVQLRRQARAAEPVTLEQVKALEVAVCHGQSGEALRLLHHMRNALAAPQPAQTQLALTDTDLEKLYWTAMNNAADILRYMDEARAILAAQPVSGQTEGNQ
jgi:hypothetical protein